MTSTSDEKCEHSVFSDPVTGGSPTSPDPRNMMCDQDIGSSVPQFLLGYTCPVSRGIFVQERAYIDEIPAAFLLQNILQLHQQR